MPQNRFQTSSELGVRSICASLVSRRIPKDSPKAFLRAPTSLEPLLVSVELSGFELSIVIIFTHKKSNAWDSPKCFHSPASLYAFFWVQSWPKSWPFCPLVAELTQSLLAACPHESSCLSPAPLMLWSRWQIHLLEKIGLTFEPKKCIVIMT